jgi:hypothetical protein
MRVLTVLRYGTCTAGFTLRRIISSGTKPTYVTSDPNKIASRHALYNNNATLAPQWRKPFFTLQPSPTQDETRGPLITIFFAIVIQRSLSGTGLESLLFWGRIMLAPATSTACMSSTAFCSTSKTLWCQKRDGCRIANGMNL